MRVWGGQLGNYRQLTGARALPGRMRNLPKFADSQRDFMNAGQKITACKGVQVAHIIRSLHVERQPVEFPMHEDMSQEPEEIHEPSMVASEAACRVPRPQATAVCE